VLFLALNATLNVYGQNKESFRNLQSQSQCQYLALPITPVGTGMKKVSDQVRYNHILGGEMTMWRQQSHRQQQKNQSQDQCCQMAYFQPKNHSLGKFWKVLQWKMLFFMAIVSTLRPNGIFVLPLVVILYIISHFGIFYREKSGNPGHDQVEDHIQYTNMHLSKHLRFISKIPFKVSHCLVSW
jgi:hypothetical protein